jgi:hypothetical protein
MRVSDSLIDARPGRISGERVTIEKYPPDQQQECL